MNLLSIEVFVTIVLLSAGVYFSTQSISALVVVFLLLCLFAYFLGVWLGVPLEFPIQFVFDTQYAPEPIGTGITFDWSLPAPISAPEVFFVSSKKYTYKEAPNVCAVYDSQLATYDQVLEAYGRGAEWCGYGWTQGAMALYPTQDKTWKFLQQDDDNKKRKSCGHPGVNGGYFDPSTRFGVNCYGVKPSCNNKKYPIPIGASSQDQATINAMKKDMSSIKILPFNRDGWSQWSM